jgi:dTDP-4-amino-4,6-dideoxygalactose transaminase
VGARPVFADIDRETFNLNTSAVEQLLDHRVRVKAILPVHLFGQCADMDNFCRIGNERKVAVIEDAAQAFGATWRGRRAGSLGDLGCFSFYPTKNLGAFGDAGCVTTNDEKLAAQVRLLRNHGMPRRYVHEEIGWNSRLDSIQAAVLSVKLKHLERWNRERQERARTYFKLFESAGLAGVNSPLRIPQTIASASHIYHQFTIRAERRDQLRQFLAERNIGSEIFYPIPIHRQPCFDYLGYGEGSMPVAEQAAREALSLPMFAEITEEEQQVVVAAIADFYS